MTKVEITKLQRQLKESGYYTGPIDSIYGPNTGAAYQKWLNDNTPAEMDTPAPASAKPWYLSRAIIGILVSAVAVFAERMGWMVDSDELTILVMQLLEFGGLALAFVGTVRRKSPIDPTLVAPGMRLNSRASKVPADSTDVSHLRGPFGY